MPIQSQNIIIRPARERGHADHGWLNSYHTFSFGGYHDPKHMGFHTLRVINEDRIGPGTGFGAHPHQDMEIVSYVVSGALEHQDSMGNKTIIRPDEVQIMSAGTGVVHAEMNHFKDRPTHFFQIWVLPEKKGTAPRYGQKSFKDSFAKQKLTLVASKDQRDGSIGINQNADIYLGKLKANEEVIFAATPAHHIWMQMISGAMDINKENVRAGDGAAVRQENRLHFTATENAEFLLFDLS